MCHCYCIFWVRPYLYMYQLFMTGEGGVGGRIVGFVFRGDNAGAGWAGWCSGEIMHVVFRGDNAVWN